MRLATARAANCDEVKLRSSGQQDVLKVTYLVASLLFATGIGHVLVSVKPGVISTSPVTELARYALTLRFNQSVLQSALNASAAAVVLENNEILSGSMVALGANQTSINMFLSDHRCYKLLCGPNVSAHLLLEHELGPHTNIQQQYFTEVPIQKKPPYRFAFYNLTEGNQIHYAKHSLNVSCYYQKPVYDKSYGRQGNTRCQDLTVWHSRYVSFKPNMCWSPNCISIDHCLTTQNPPTTVLRKSITLDGLEGLVGFSSQEYVASVQNWFADRKRTRIHVIGDSVASGLYTSMAYLMRNDDAWCSVEYQQNITSSYTVPAKDNLTLISIENSKIKLSYRFQVNFCPEGKIKGLPEEQIAKSLGLHEPVDVIIFQGGLWDMQDRNYEDCLSSLPKIFDFLRGFQGKKELIFFSPAPYNYMSDIIAWRYRSNKRLLEYHGIMKSEATRTGAHFYDSYVKLLPVSTFATDGRHYPQHTTT